jgi:HD-GYP domain-containing protein (c-di-GMP phosphodiesterase class II)
MVPLAKSIGASIERDPKALINLVRLKEKDQYTYLHSVAVCALMMNFARHLELDERVVQDLGVAGLLHDVGKIAISDDILTKSGALSDLERDSVRGHPAAGHRLLANSKDVPEAALEVCLRHHEKVDGAGYPDGLSGEALSLFARMGAICDVYDAVTSNRPYKDPWTPCEALTEMQQWQGHFDSRLLEQFADSLGIYPVGTLVRLSCGELGVVTGSAGDYAEDVMVRIFFDCETLTEIAFHDRAIAPSADNPRIVGRDSPTFWRFADWDAMRHRILAAQVDMLPAEGDGARLAP